MRVCTLLEVKPDLTGRVTGSSGTGSSPEALLVLLGGHDGGQEELKVADGTLHGDVKRTQQRTPLLQHLLGGRLRKISVKKQETKEWSF